MTARIIDFEKGRDDEYFDIHDLMLTTGRTRDTIRRQMRSGIIPPALDRLGGEHGGAFRWTIGYMREWQRKREAICLEASVQKMTSRMRKDAIRRVPKAPHQSEFG